MLYIFKESIYYHEQEKKESCCVFFNCLIAIIAEYRFPIPGMVFHRGGEIRSICQLLCSRYYLGIIYLSFGSKIA